MGNIDKLDVPILNELIKQYLINRPPYCGYSKKFYLKWFKNK